MAGVYTPTGAWFDVDATLATIAEVLTSDSLSHGDRSALESIVDGHHCDACGLVSCRGEGPGVCACDSALCEYCGNTAEAFCCQQE